MQEAQEPVNQDLILVNLTNLELSRFWSKVNKKGALPDQNSPHYHGIGRCWEWTASKSTSGYGHFRLRTKLISSHRISWFIHTKSWPLDCILHRCDNRKCVNPSHLFEGTPQQNANDCLIKGRFTDGRGEKNSSCKLTEDQVSQIRCSYVREVVTLAALGKQFGVTKNAVLSIIQRKTWRHLP